MSDPGFVRSLGAGLAILDRLLEAGGAETGFGALKAATGLKHATFARSVKLLLAQGYLAKEGRGYRLGRRAIQLGTRALDAEDLRQRCRGTMLELMRDSKVRTELHVRRDGGFVLVEVHDPVHDPGLRFDLGVWRASTLHSPVDRLLAAYATAAPAGPLDRLRRQGWAAGLVKRRSGDVYRAAAPVLAADGGCLAVLAVAVPEGQADAARRSSLLTLVRHHAAACSDPPGVSP